MKVITMNKRYNGMAKRKRSEHVFCWTFLLWPIGGFLLIGIPAQYIYPISLSFQKIDLSGNTAFAGFANFVEYFKLLTTDGDLLLLSFKNSMLMYVLNLVFTTVFSYLFAYLIFKKCAGYKIMRVICFIPSAVSSMIFGLCFQKFVSTALPDMLMALGYSQYLDMFADSKWIFFILNFYILWTSFTSSIIIIPNSMASIDPELFEAGQIDGIHTMLQEMWYIVFPGIWDVMATYFVIGIAGLFSSSGCTLLFYEYNAPNEAFNLGYYYTYLTMTADNEMFYPVLSAGGLVMTAICAPLTFFVKWLTEKCPWYSTNSGD